MLERAENTGHPPETALPKPENSAHLRQWVEPTWIEYDIGIVKNGSITPSSSDLTTPYS